MTDIITESQRDAVRERLLEALDCEFGADTVTDQHLPEIFGKLDEIMQVAAEAKLEREWAEDFLARVYTSMDPAVICQDERATHGYGYIYWNRALDDSSRKAVTGYQYRTGYPTRHWVQYWASPYYFVVLGPFETSEEAGRVRDKLNSGWTAVCLSDYACGRVESNDPAYLGRREIIDLASRRDQMGNGMCVREVHFLSSSRIVPDNTMVLLQSVVQAEEVA